jgi:LCP family protein required for cell wall assembly
VSGFYTWLVNRSADAPDIPAGLAAHIGDIESDQTFDLTAEIHKDRLADGSKVAIVLVGDDVILAVSEGFGWRIVGARLTGFGLGPWYGDPVRHVFVIGTDARPHQSQPAFRADSLHIVAASLPERGGAVVGFPRDTYVETSYGSDKFTNVNVRGGTEEMVRIAEDLSSLSIEGYILTGFAGFKHLINTFGGVEVDIPFHMSDDSSNAFLDAGLQILKGGDALAFSRNRHIDGGDFTRSFHQGIVIQAGLTGAQAMGFRRLPRLLRLLSEDSWTDLSTAQLLQLGATAFELDPAAVHNVVLPGRVETVRTSSVVRLTPGADTIFADLADGVLTTD